MQTASVSPASISSRSKAAQISKIKGAKVEDTYKEYRDCAFSFYSSIKKAGHTALYGKITLHDGTEGYIRVSKRGDIVRVNVKSQEPSYSTVRVDKLVDRFSGNLQDYLLDRLNGVQGIDFPANVTQNNNLSVGYRNTLNMMKAGNQAALSTFERLLSESIDSETGLVDDAGLKEAVAREANIHRFNASAISSAKTAYFNQLKAEAKAARDKAREEEKAAREAAKKDMAAKASTPAPAPVQAGGPLDDDSDNTPEPEVPIAPAPAAEPIPGDTAINPYPSTEEVEEVEVEAVIEA